MPLVLHKKEGETWKQAALRQASSFKLQDEVTTAYNNYTKNGMPKEEAAWCACYDWDLLDYEVD